MNLLNNLCPLDGRYRSATEELRRVWGDCQLMRLRVYVELKWLEFFVANVHPKVPLTAEQQRDLEPLYEVTDENLERILEIEKETKHDVKAVEYYLRERVARVCSLASLQELLHILLTSEDVNSVAYSLMTKRVLQEVLLPQMRAIQRRSSQGLMASPRAPQLLERSLRFTATA
ncbi:adenylosuccinate lyase, putative [Eimeria necatrix]|uniref:Adenylosuccinate lyase, putative n=1 Tax=Eimeria necatrix TaxID=51315 RepID=U6ME45_9EIME|nr:adenylosuccinate lyase, putative [Eimeria necatrix]CDJ62286.1 adenylosuccinate lyase, putative [Eimeria necatrix]